MLGRKDYTQDELEHAKATVDELMAAYRGLAAAVEDAGSDPKVVAALEALEPVLFNNMVLALDRYFVHRVRLVTGTDGNPLNETELLAESLMNNDGVFRGNNVVRYGPAASVLGLTPGERIRLTAAEFDRLATAFLVELNTRFVARPSTGDTIGDCP